MIAALHTLLLLADSALPLGSFAFSSGLESFLAHHKQLHSSSVVKTSPAQLHAFHSFLTLSLSSIASTALPYVLAGYRDASNLEQLDNDLDASTPCAVARRASVAQGKALLSIYERSFKEIRGNEDSSFAVRAIVEFQALLKQPALKFGGLPPSGHYAPLWGVLTRALSLPEHEAAYLFLFSHVRTVTSAAVRASVLGPYQAQGILASDDLQMRINVLLKEFWHTSVEDAGQTVPAMDLWVGRHEMLYSRIFNS